MNASQQAYHRELDRANRTIREAGALMVEDDGFKWVDEAKLPAEFCDYYSGLKSAGYANGYL